MPTIRQYDVPVEAEVTVDFDVEVEEFLDECDESEIDKIIQWLKNKIYLKGSSIIDQVSVAESEFIEALDKIYTKWNVLSTEETELIINISKRF